MYIEQGTVRLSVLSRAGKEAVIAVLERWHFFGEGRLRNSLRIDSAHIGRPKWRCFTF